MAKVYEAMVVAKTRRLLTSVDSAMTTDVNISKDMSNVKDAGAAQVKAVDKIVCSKLQG